MKKFFIKYSIIIIFLIIFISAYYSGISFDDLYSSLKKLNLWQITILFLWFIFIASISISGKKLILYFFGYPIGIKNIILIHFASISAHYSTPAKIGFPITIYLLKKLEGVPLAVATATIVVELFATVGLMGIVAVVGSVMYFGDQLKSLSNGLLVILVILSIVSLIIYLLYSKSNKVRSILKEVRISIKLLSPGKILLYIFVQAAVIVASTIHIVLISYFLGNEINFWYAIVANSSAFVIGAVSMVPMGLGTRDLSMVFYLSRFGIPSEIAILITAIQRIISTGMGYVLGLISSGIIGVKSLKSIKD